MQIICIEGKSGIKGAICAKKKPTRFISNPVGHCLSLIFCLFLLYFLFYSLLIIDFATVIRSPVLNRSLLMLFTKS